MADNLTTATQVDPAVATYYDRVLLEAAYPQLVHLKFAQNASLDTKSGNTYKWRRYDNLSDATTPLNSDGSDPPGVALSKTDLTATVSWYGNFVKITDEVDLTVEDPVLTVAADKLGKNEGKTFDTLMRDILMACASSTNASGGSNGETPTEVTRSDIDGVVETMLGNDAKFITTMIKGGTGYGTAPVRPAFWGIINSAVVMDLENCVGFKSTSEYASQGDIDEAEWGSIGNTRWLHSTNAYVYDTATDQYWLPIIGQDAYGDVTLMGSQNIVKGFDQSGSVLNRYATSGWKKVWAARILNDNYMHLLKTTAAS